MGAFDFNARLQAAAARVEAALQRALPPEGPGAEGRLAAAMRRAALSGGKRLRAYLVIETAALFSAPEAGADRAAAALECLHAYSLAHDDLPCMDDDDMRRGLPTLHIEWDEATAVLAGDALQTLAFELMTGPETAADGGVRAELAFTLARASGFAGMVGGQALDIAAETAPAPLSLSEIETLQAKKTGALIEAAVLSGAILGGAGETERAALTAYARALGAAFQIADDILDAEGDPALAGKRLGKDAEAGKATFVTLLGLQGAKTRAEELVSGAEAALSGFSGAKALRHAARFAISRRN